MPLRRSACSCWISGSRNSAWNSAKTYTSALWDKKTNRNHFDFHIIEAFVVVKVSKPAKFIRFRYPLGVTHRTTCFKFLAAKTLKQLSRSPNTRRIYYQQHCTYKVYNWKRSHHLSKHLISVANHTCPTSTMAQTNALRTSPLHRLPNVVGDKSVLANLLLRLQFVLPLLLGVLLRNARHLKARCGRLVLVAAGGDPFCMLPTRLPGVRWP